MEPWSLALYLSSLVYDMSGLVFFFWYIVNPQHRSQTIGLPDIGPHLLEL